MKIIVLILSIVIMLTACNKPNKKLKEILSNSDSVAVNYFKGDGSMDSVVDVKIIRNKKTIEDLTNLITASSSKPPVKCGYDGSLHFFKKNMVAQDIDFRMNDAACMYFTFKQNGEPSATVLSEDAKSLLKMLQKQ